MTDIHQEKPTKTTIKKEVHKAAKKETPKMGPVPNAPQPEYNNPKPKLPNVPFDKFQRYITNMSNTLGKLIAKGILVAAVLTGWAKKETPSPTEDNPLPKATFTAGALGMTLMKTKINNGNQKTDFDSKLLLAETAHEVANKLTPELTTKAFFEENPIEKGVYGNKAKEILREASQQQTAKRTLTAKEIAEKIGKISER